MLASILERRNFMNIWNIGKVREENVLVGLLNACKKKKLENFVTDFTPGFLEERGKNRPKGGVSRHVITYSQT